MRKLFITNVNEYFNGRVIQIKARTVLKSQYVNYYEKKKNFFQHIKMSNPRKIMKKIERQK